MKTLTFFNEKGGTGKTTLTILFASWLRYEKGEEVAVLDFDAPSFHLNAIREQENTILQRDNPPFRKLCAGNDFYDIFKIDIAGRKTSGTLAERDRCTPEDLAFIEHQVNILKKGRRGYLLFDFPGRFNAGEPFYYLASRGHLNQIVFPIDSDSQSVTSALYVWMQLHHKDFLSLYRLDEPPATTMLWNRETASERRPGKKDIYERQEKLLALAGVDVMQQRIHQIDILRRDFVDGTPHSRSFLRSTYCYPKQNVISSCPYLEDVFEEIKARLDGQFNNNSSFASKKW